MLNIIIHQGNTILNYKENHYIPAEMALKQTLPSADKDVKPSHIAGGNVNWHSFIVKGSCIVLAVSYKIKHTLT